MTTREEIVAAARAWVGTPYHHHASLKGKGCDCLMLIAESYAEVGLLPSDIEIPDYPPDIMFHKDDHSYLEAVLSYCDEVDTPRPGDVVMWKFGMTYSHAGIVSAWPRVVHAYIRLGQVIEMDINEDSRLTKRQMRFFSPRGIA